jgi:hypothetical protein
MSLILGEIATVNAQVKDANKNLVDPTTISFSITDPTGAEATPTPAHDGLGHYHVNVTMSATGTWRYRWITTGIVAPFEGTLEVESIYEGAVTDLRDLRVLVPACRRAIDGPMATSPDAPSTTLDDRAVLALLADSTASMILNSVGNAAFGYQLLPTARDPFYKAPVAWATDTERSPAADAAILSQAALDHYFWLIRILKVSETMKNEAQEWTYAISANVISAWVKYLIDNRDRAIASLQVINAPLDVYISLVAERDRLAASWLEPWVAEVGAPVPYVGGGGSGPLEYDYRFNTWG